MAKESQESTFWARWGQFWESFEKGKNVIADFAVKHKEDYTDVNFNSMWAKLRSAISIPILDSGNIPMGTLYIDSDVTYDAAGFENISEWLTMLANSLGRLLEVG